MRSSLNRLVISPHLHFVFILFLASCSDQQSIDLLASSLSLKSAQIQFLSSPQTMIAGSCTLLPFALTANKKDVFIPDQEYSFTASANLSGLPSGVSAPAQLLFKDESCLIPLDSTVRIDPTHPMGSVFAYSELALPIQVTLSHPVWGQAQLSSNVQPHPTPQYLVMGNPLSAQAGLCVGPLNAVSQDFYGNALTATSTKNLTIANDTGLNLFTNNTCTLPLNASTVSIPNGLNTSNSFFIQSTQAVLSSLWVTGYNTAQKSILFIPGAATRIKPLGPSTTQVGKCTSFQFRVEDAFGNLTALTANQNVMHTHLGTFYTSASCSSLAQNPMPFAVGDTVRAVYYKNDVIVANDNIQLTSSFGVSSQSISVLSNPPTEISIDTQSPDLPNNACRLIRLDLLDNLGLQATSPTALSASLYPTTISFFSNANCTQAINSLNIPANTSRVDYYMRMSQPQPTKILAVSAQIPGLIYNTLSIRPQFYFKVLDMLTVIQSADCNGNAFGDSFPCSVFYNDSTGVKKLPASAPTVTFDNGVNMNFNTCKAFSYDYAFTQNPVPTNSGQSFVNAFNNFAQIVISPGDTLTSVVKLNEQLVTHTPPLNSQGCSGFSDILWTLQANLRQF